MSHDYYIAMHIGMDVVLDDHIKQMLPEGMNYIIKGSSHPYYVYGDFSDSRIFGCQLVINDIPISDAFPYIKCSCPYPMKFYQICTGYALGVDWLCYHYFSLKLYHDTWTMDSIKIFDVLFSTQPPDECRIHYYYAQQYWNIYLKYFEDENYHMAKCVLVVWLDYMVGVIHKYLTVID